MLNKSDKNKKHFPLLLMMLLLSLLMGCGSAHEIQTAEPVSAEMIANANVENGRKLFMGYAHFQHEGPPCMGCHSVGENGLLGGGAMGPDLTNVSTRRSDAEILGIMSNMGTDNSPVMQPIYATDPLTVEEQADLLAFMKSSVGQPEADKELLVFGISIIGTFAAAIILGFIYRNRLRSVRRALVNKAEKELL
ncbi:MAG: cytochrome c [Anaerolineales bacterium]|nr:cytochrome c [Anaerolineales bacterium]